MTVKGSGRCMHAGTIVSLLRQRMNEMVVSYQSTANVIRVGPPIDGTAFFPGGVGLWRGREPFGELPTHFPQSPVMLIGHNFDSVAGYEKSLKRGIERLGSPTWRYLLAYLEEARVPPDDCFFTNALMGLQPVSARGKFAVSDEFREESRRFLEWQIAFIVPRLVVVLGNDALTEYRQIACPAPWIGLRHPMSLMYAKNSDRSDIITQQARELRGALTRVREGAAEIEAQGEIT